MRISTKLTGPRTSAMQAAATPQATQMAASQVGAPNLQQAGRKVHTTLETYSMLAHAAWFSCCLSGCGGEHATHANVWPKLHSCAKS
jgi:hypothetical protein